MVSLEILPVVNPIGDAVIGVCIKVLLISGEVPVHLAEGCTSSTPSSVEGVGTLIGAIVFPVMPENLGSTTI